LVSKSPKNDRKSPKIGEHCEIKPCGSLLGSVWRMFFFVSFKKAMKSGGF